MLVVDGPKLTAEERIAAERHGILINAILSYLKNEVVEHNKEMSRLRMPRESFRTFCYGTMFLKLAFMDDADVKHIAAKILG